MKMNTKETVIFLLNNIDYGNYSYEDLHSIIYLKAKKHVSEYILRVACHEMVKKYNWTRHGSYEDNRNVIFCCDIEKNKKTKALEEKRIKEDKINQYYSYIASML